MKKKEPQINENSSGQIRQLIQKYLPYWPIFLILMVLSIGYAFYYLKTTMPSYRATASILVKDEKKGEEYSKMEQMLNLFGTKNIVENQIEIISSIPALTDAVRTLDLCTPVYEQTGWKGYKISSGYTSSPIEVSSKNPDRIISPKLNRIYFKYDGNSVVINNVSYPLDQWVKTPWDTLRFSINPRYYPAPPSADGKVHEEPKYFFSLINEKGMVKMLKGAFSATAKNKLATVIELKIEDQHPDRAEAILNEIVNAYHRLTIERTNQVARNTLEWIEKRLANVTGELDSLGSSIENFRTSAGAIDIGEQGRTYLQATQQSDALLHTYELQLSALEEVERHVKSNDTNGTISPSLININDPVMRDLLQQLSLAEAKYQALQSKAGENSVTMRTLREEINQTKGKIIGNIANQKSILKSSINRINVTGKEFNARLSAIPKQERDLLDVSRAQATKKEIYAFLLSKKEEVSYSLNSTDYNSYFVDKPVAVNGPVKPNVNLAALMALILPLGLGVAGISLRDMFNGRILYRTDIEKLSTLPVVGELVFDKNAYTDTSGRRFVVEQFRHLRHSMKYFSEPDVPMKRVMVSSSIMGEGKSFVSINLAKSLVRSGKKVALLELDLHKPKLRKFFGIDEVPGITDYLTGQATEKEIVIPIPESNSKLFLVPSGTIEDGAEELLHNNNFEILLNYLDTEFDILVIDSPPVKAISDAYVIAPFVQLTLFVIRHNYTPKDIIETLDSDMQDHNMQNIALVFNGVKRRGFGRFGFGYGSGYGYDDRKTYENYNSKKRK